MTSIGAERLTYEAWLVMPETKQRYEIVDGVMIMAAAPSADHQWLSGEIYWKLREFVELRGLGVVLFAPVDLLIQREPLRTRQPDVLYLSAERTGIRGRRELRGFQVLDVAPDIIVEVLSPSNSRRDIQEKLEDYRRLGVLECWLVSPEAETIETMRLSSEGVSTGAVYGVNDTLISSVLDGFELPLSDVFGESKAGSEGR
jgi:Uma2 family endonuclease